MDAFDLAALPRAWGAVTFCKFAEGAMSARGVVSGLNSRVERARTAQAAFLGARQGRGKSDEPTSHGRYVASSCMHRSLNASQRALIAAGFLEYERAEAKKRQKAGVNLPENFPEGGEARDKAGERMQVSGRTVDEAARVMENAVRPSTSGKFSLAVALS